MRNVVQLTAVLMASTSATYANLVINPGFENPGVGGSGFYRYTSPGVPAGFNWTVGGAGVDVVDSIWWQPQSGAQSLDLNAGGYAGSVSQLLATSADTMYRVSFWIAANPNHSAPESEGPAIKTMDVAFGSTTYSYSFDVTGHSESSMGWRYEEFLASTTSASTLLSFLSTSGGYAGMTLDNVNVEAVAVPEPSTYVAGVLLFLPFGAQLIRRLRTRNLPNSAKLSAGTSGAG